MSVLRWRACFYTFFMREHLRLRCLLLRAMSGLRGEEKMATYLAVSIRREPERVLSL